MALFIFYRLAQSRFARLSPLLKCVVVCALYARLRETVRLILMDGVVTSAWTYSLVQKLPEILAHFILSCMVVFISPRLRGVSRTVAGILIVLVIRLLAVVPLLRAAFVSIMRSISYLNHADVYPFPYGWQVLVPAYVTFAEPVLACTIIAALVGPKLSASATVRVWQFVALIMFMRGSVLPILVYSFYLKYRLPVAILSESQFTLEALSLAVLTALVWQRFQSHDSDASPDPSAGSRRFGIRANSK